MEQDQLGMEITGKRYISWDEVHRACAELAARIKTHMQPRYILAVGKGGLIPAGILWQYFPYSIMAVAHIQSYEHQTRKKLRYVQPLPEHPSVISPEEVLVVDDICDSGATFRDLRQYYGRRATFVSMYRRQTTSFLPDHQYEIVPDGVWLEFPWETSYD